MFSYAWRILLLALWVNLSINSPAAAKSEMGTPDNDDIHITFVSETGSFSKPRLLFKKGSSPEVIRLRSALAGFDTGVYLLYYVDFSNWKGGHHQERTVLSFSHDGETWTRPARISFDDLEMEKRCVDPSLVQLDDGRLRMYFMTPGKTRSEKRIMSATSLDGFHFKMEDGVRLISRGNPEVAGYGKKWLMFTSEEIRHVTEVAVSDDGLKWKYTEGTEIPGIAPGAFLDGSNEVKLYSNHNGISLFSFNPVNNKSRLLKERVFSYEPIIGDPSPEFTNDGMLLIFKHRQVPRM